MSFGKCDFVHTQSSCLWNEFLHFGPGMSYRLSWYSKTSAITTFIYELWSYICPKTIRSWEIWPKPFFGLLHQIFLAKFLYFGPGRSHRLFRCIQISTVSTFIYKLWSNICPKTIRRRDIGGKSNFVHTHSSYFWNKFCILVQESPSDNSDTPKQAQSSHLYTSYEATYALKWSGAEIFDNNQFLVARTRFIRQNPCILVHEGPTHYSDTPKWAEWALLYTSHESIYALKWSGREILAKNCFPIFPIWKWILPKSGLEKSEKSGCPPPPIFPW